MKFSASLRTKKASQLLKGLLLFFVGMTALVFLVDTFCLAIADKAEIDVEDVCEIEEDGIEEAPSVSFFFEMHQAFGDWTLFSVFVSPCFATARCTSETLPSSGWSVPLLI